MAPQVPLQHSRNTGSRNKLRRMAGRQEVERQGTGWQEDRKQKDKAQHARKTGSR